ncbi:hypothetical protein MTO96_042839, partial [Rhipicephalus appendiculatus]
QQLEQQAATAIGGWLREKAKEATASASRHSPSATSTTAATSLALDKQVASSPLPLSSDEGEMDTQCCRKHTHAASDSDEPAQPPKQAATIAAEPPALDDAADFRVVQETPASVDIEYLHEGLPLRDACLQAVHVPLNALQCT